jgi:hypothetical protein
MADSSGPAFNGRGGTSESVGSTISGGDDIIRIDPGAIDASAAAETGNTTVRPGYGPNGRKLNKDGTERKAKGTGRATNANPAPQASFSVEALAGTIAGVHALLSATLKIPELALDPKESVQLASALANLQRFYPVIISEKSLAIGNVMMAVGLIYGTRIAAIGARKSAERRQGDNVIRPQAFQRPPQPTVQQPPQQAASAAPPMMPDGDDLATQKPPQVTPRSVNPADQVFVATPPHLM